MTIDWQSLLYDAKQTVLGVSAVLQPNDFSASHDCSVIDKTGGVTVGGDEGEGIVQYSIVPAAIIRAQEVDDLGLTRSDLDGGRLTMNSKTWRISSHASKPSPAGELAGDYVLYLIELDA